MRLAFIAPFSMLNQTAHCDFSLMLPQLVENPDYAKYFHSLAPNEDKYVILDNGAAEDVKISASKLLSTGNLFGVDEIVAPDIIGEGWGTYSRAGEFFGYVDHNDWSSEFSYGYALQGKSVEYFLDAIPSLLNSPFNDLINVWYVPRALMQFTHDPFARLKVAKLLLRYDQDLRPIHFLGMHPRYPEELKFLVAENEPRFRSLDTSLPFVYALQGHKIAETDNGYITRQDDFFESKSSVATRMLADENCEILEGWARG
jgi:hypothetical protein